MADPGEALIEVAKRYLKERYGEDTLSMMVTQNAVEKGEGVLSVDCTVSTGGVSSDWSKKFTFHGGKVTTMSARLR